MFSWARRHAYGKALRVFITPKLRWHGDIITALAWETKNETLVLFRRLGLSKERPKNRCWPPMVPDYIIDQGLAPQLITLLYCHEPQQPETSGWPGTGQNIAVTLTLAKELCGFDLLFDEGRLDLVNSTCHLSSDSGYNLEAAKPFESFAFNQGLGPDSGPWRWFLGCLSCQPARRSRRSKMLMELLRITAVERLE